MLQRFEYDIASIRSRWQGRQGAWIIDASSRMVSYSVHDMTPCSTARVKSDCNHPDPFLGHILFQSPYFE